MTQVIHACMICGKVYKYTDTTAHKKDVISHGLCGCKKCMEIISKVSQGIAERTNCPPIWEPIVKQK